MEGGRLFVSVIPQYATAAKKMASYFSQQGAKVGKEFSEQFTRATKETLKPVEYHVNLSKKDISKAQRQLNELTKGRAAALRIDAKANVKQVDEQISTIRKRIDTARAGAVGIIVDPAKAKAAGVEAEKAGFATGEKFSGAFRSAMSLGMTLAGFAIAGFAVHSLKAAGDFQASMNLLVTAGGENRKALGMISSGIKEMAQTTGTSTDQLAEGMYTIEKAGIRGAKGLDVLKASAEGAKAENVDLGTMTQALTSIMASYGSKMKDPVKATNELVAAAGASKTTMTDFATSLSTVQPIAAAAHIPFDQLGGAIATLTSHGTTAHEATVELANSIRGLQAPNAVAQKEMAQFGINSIDVSAKLGKRGLQGTIDLLSNTVLKKMGPSGKILLGAFNQSKIAAQDADQMFGKLPKSVQDVAKSYKDGKISLGDWRKEMKDMTPANAALASQWATSENKSKAFNDQLRTGTPAGRTYISSMKKMMGGATGLNTALQLTGESSHRFTEATKEIGDAGKKTGKDISTWASTQKTFNVQMDKLKQTVQVGAVVLGTALLPVVASLAKTFMNNVVPAIKAVWTNLTPVFTFIGQHQTAFKILALSVLAFWVAFKTLEKAKAIITGFSDSMKLLNKTMKANVVLLIVAALIALGVAFYEAYTHSARFRNDVNRVLNDVKNVALAVVHWFTGPFVNFFKKAASDVVSAFHAFLNFFTHTIPNAFQSVIDFLGRHWKLIVAILIAPFSIVLAIIVGLVLHFWGPISNAFAVGFHAIASVAKVAWGVILAIFRVALQVIKIAFEVIYAILAIPWIYAFKAIMAITRLVWGWIGPYVKIGFAALVLIFTTSLGIIKAIWSAVWGAIKKTASVIWGGIVAFFKAAFKLFETVVLFYFNIYKSIILAIWRSILKPLIGVWQSIAGFFVSAWRGFKLVVSSQWHAITGLVVSAWHAITKPLESAWGTISGFFSRVWIDFSKKASGTWNAIAGAIPAAFGGIVGLVSKHWNTILQVIESPLKLIIKLINDFIGFLNGVPGVDIPKIPTGWLAKDSGGGVKSTTAADSGGPRKLTAATGGILPGYTPGKDVHTFVSPTGGLLHLSGGEAVMRPEWTAAVGAGNVHKMNAAARSGGIRGVQTALGMPEQAHLFGGIIKDIGKFGGYVGKKAKGAAEEPVKLADSVFVHAVNAAASVARKAARVLPNGMPEDMAEGFINKVVTAITHDGNSDIKKNMAQSGVGGGSILQYAKTFLGTPYVWGGGEPGGFDCSGLVQYVLNHFGIHAPRTAAMQQKWASTESRAAALPGDQVFWGNPAHHTAFFMGGNKMLEAPHTGANVMVADLYGSPTFGRDPGVAGSLLGGPGSAALPTGGGSPAANRALGKKIATQMGYGSQFDAIDYVASHESGWRTNAQNPTSSAYGIGQFINATWAKYGGKTNDAGQQIKDMIEYMVDDYKSPRGAMQHWEQYHSYANGGRFQAGETALVGERGPEIAHFATGGVITNAAQTKKLLTRSAYESSIKPKPKPKVAPPIEKHTAEQWAKIIAQALRLAAQKATHDTRASLLATGQALVGTIMSGMNGAASSGDISAATATVLSKINKAFTGSRKSALVTWVTNENTALQRLASKRDSISGQLAAASDYATTVRGAAKSNAGITSLSDTSGVNTIQAGLQTKLKQTKQFNADIKTLSRKGLSRELLGQLIDAGVDSGGPIARQLAKASTNRIKQLNATQRNIDTASAQLGNTAVNFKFGDNASKDFVAGLKKQRAALSREMSLMAESFARNVRRALDMKASGTHTKATHDNGGWLMPGVPALNLTGRPEPVLTAHQWKVAEANIARPAASADDIGRAVAMYMDGARLHIDPNGVTTMINDQNLKNGRRHR
jgi:phage-related protein